MVSAAKASLQRWERAMSGPGDSGITVDYLREDIKRLKIRITLQKHEREVGLDEAALRASYAEAGYGLTTFWSWRVSMMHDALRLLCEEHELQADVMRKIDERVVLFEKEREREMRERIETEKREEREKRRVRIFRPRSNCAVPARPNMSRS